MALVRAVDGWYAWLVLFASALCNLLTMGFLFGSVGILTAEYNKEFGVDVRTSSWVGSVLCGVLLCSGPLTAFIIGKFGCRLVATVAACLHIGGFAVSGFATSIWQIILAYAIISGFSCSCCHVATMKILTLYFKKHQHLAYSVAAVGTDLAVASYPFLAQQIFHALSFKYSILSLAAILLPVVPCTLLFIEHGIIEKTVYEGPSSEDSTNESLDPDTAVTPLTHTPLPDNKLATSDEKEKITPANDPNSHGIKDHILLLRKPAVLVFLLNTSLWNCGGAAMSVLAFSYYIDSGFTADNASLGMTSYGLGALLGSVSLSIVSIKLRFNRLVFHWFLNLMLCILLVVFPLLKTSTGMAVCLGAFGFSYGTLCANLGSLTEHINGSRLLYLVYAYEMAAGGIGSFIGPVATANLQKSFNAAVGFYFGGGLCGLGLLVMILYAICNRKFLHPHDRPPQQEPVENVEPVVITQSSLSLAAYL